MPTGINSYITIMEIRSYDLKGNEVPPSTCTMDSILSGSYPASNCIDGYTSTMCHSAANGGGWLEVDYGSSVAIATIWIQRGNHDIQGAAIQLWTGPHQTGTMIWQSVFTGSSTYYSFAVTGVRIQLPPFHVFLSVYVSVCGCACV